MSHLHNRKQFYRQTSLQNDSISTPPSLRTTPIQPSVNPTNQPSTNARPNKPPLIGILRNKQRSEELPDDHPQRPTGVSRVKSALGNQKCRVSSKTRPNMVKVAWGDIVGDIEPLLAKKEMFLNRMTAIKVGIGPMRPQNNAVSTFPASEREQSLVLCSREQLAQRLRMAWHDRETSKKNLNIILTPEIRDGESPEDDFTCLGPADYLKEDKEICTDIANDKPGPFLRQSSLEQHKNMTDTNIVDVTNIFQRTVNRRTLKYEQQQQNNYEPSRNSENDPLIKRPSRISVVPTIIENKFSKIESPVVPSEHNNNKLKLNVADIDYDTGAPLVETNQPITKRELFQKKANTTIDTPIKPRLVRASSVPLKYTNKSAKPNSQSKVANIMPKRRRIKSTTALLRRGNQTVSSNQSDRLMSSLNTPQQMNMHNRQVYQHSKDIVTMVSLLSPNLTDNEDDNDDNVEERLSLVMADDKKQTAPKHCSEKSVKVHQHQFTSSLRKTVKSVSFQQSSIHSVRSFCASFPGRRGSVGTTGNTYSGTTHQYTAHKKSSNTTASILLGGGTGNIGNKVQEKRGSFSEGNEDAAKPKRRLVRTVSETNDACYTSEMTTPTKTNADQSPINIKTSQQIPTLATVITSDLSTSQETVVQTVSDKEAYCINTYRKLTDSGINISLETILRGMLTPTEYRLRCKREEMLINQDGRQENGGGEAAEDNMATLSNDKEKNVVD